MIIVLSPAKTLDYESRPLTKKTSQPQMIDEAQKLIDVMVTKSPAEVGKLMSISPALADLNVERYHDWDPTFTTKNSKQAILAFQGDVYRGFRADQFSERDFTHAQKHLRILSGLYGVLRPLDLMQPYRLEMGTKLTTDRGRNLYDFWGGRITDSINKDLVGSKPRALVNLASKEYFSSIQPDAIEGKVITPVFKDFSRGEYRVVAFFAKYARGVMASWLIKNRISSIKGIEQFEADGYHHSPEHSSPGMPTFIRAAR
jgi:cytoplasmic iron level regulating protein YaaA (DUF328/UPF0246 family)